MNQATTSSTQSPSSGWRAFSTKVCNALSDRASAFLEKHVGADLIIVTGPTGVGKSSFIQAITGHDLYISSTLESGTRQTALVPALIGGKRYLFLDMPGFDAADLDDWHVFTLLTTAMGTIERYVKFRGLIYVDAFDNVRATKAAEKILTWMKYFCGPEYMTNVTIVTTKWDVQADDAIDEKLERYANWSKGVLLKPLISNGATTFHHGLVRVDKHWRKLSLRKQLSERASYAREMIHNRYSASSNKTLQVYQEIADGYAVEMTSAGRYLKAGFMQDQIFQPSATVPGPSVPRSPTPTQKGKHSKPPSIDRSNEPPHDSQPRTPPPPSKSWAEIAQEVKSWIALLLQAASAYSRMSNGESAQSDGFGASESKYDDVWEASDDAWKEGDQFENDWRHHSTPEAFGNDGLKTERTQTTSSCIIL